MIVKHPELIDALQISKLANDLKLNNINGANTGFLIYPLDENGYKTRINSSFFYITKDNSKINGFLMAYDSNTLNNYLQNKLLSHEDGIMDFLITQTENYVFGDQIGIDPKAKRNNIGTLMMTELTKDMKFKNISTMYVAILHKPVKNLTSIAFCSKKGFKEICEVTNKDNTTWGIYKLNIN